MKVSPSTPTNNIQANDIVGDKQLNDAQQQLNQALEREKRALADYQNLVRRNQEERIRLLKFANRELIEELLRPLNHLSVAAEKIGDQGLNMVVDDFRKVMKEAGLEEINPNGEKFDLATMEVVDIVGEGDMVKQVVTRGYKLNDEVIQHAKVIVG